MKITKLISRSVLLLSFVAITTQDITERKGCDCSICKGVNKLNPVVGKKIGDGGGGKSGCNICEHRKEMLRLEREKQRRLQKCPFDILGGPPLRGKTSEEIFDEFREQIVPSQNGFFDMMRGVVRTMHESSVTEVKWAKEKEAKELAKKKKEEAEELARKRKEEAEARKQKASKPPTDELVSLDNPVSPKVTVVLKQTPCGQVLQPSETSEPEKVSLLQRFPKETNSELFRAPEHLQSIDPMGVDYLELNSRENNLNSDLIDQLIAYNMFLTPPPGNQVTGKPEQQQTKTESTFKKLDDEFKAVGGGNSLDDLVMGLGFSPNLGVGPQGVVKENAQSVEPISL